MRSAAMRTKFILVVFILLFCSACSVSVAPIATPSGIINAEYHPQDIFTRALTEKPILNGSKVSGVFYPIANLERTNYAELLVLPINEASSEPLLKFPFAIEK